MSHLSLTERARVPRFEEFHRDDTEYPAFIYRLDPDTHEPLKHTCNPDELGTYFDPDDSRLHYLTPVYFRREVLERYVAKPTTYRTTVYRLSCLNLREADIGFNTVGLVEVYLGDLGQNLPPAQRVTGSPTTSCPRARWMKAASGGTF